LAQNLVEVVLRLTDTQFKDLATVRDQYVKDGGLEGDYDVGSFTKYLLKVYGPIGTESE
jgi:hypothetical protein